MPGIFGAVENSAIDFKKDARAKSDIKLCICQSMPDREEIDKNVLGRVISRPAGHIAIEPIQLREFARLIERWPRIIEQLQRPGYVEAARLPRRSEPCHATHACDGNRSVISREINE